MLEQLRGENTSFMVQDEKEMKVFSENIISRMSLRTIIVLTYFLIQRKDVQINVQEVTIQW